MTSRASSRVSVRPRVHLTATVSRRPARSAWGAACAALLAGFAAMQPAAASAQEPVVLHLGQPVSGTLAGDGPAMTGQGTFHVYSVAAREGQRLQATLQSSDFDAFLSVLRPVGGVTELLGTDDDGDGGTDARLRWVVPASGTYFVLAHALQPGSSGRYTLVVEEAPAPRLATPRPLRVGQPTAGMLTAQSAFMDRGDDDIHYDLYIFDALAGQQFVITLDSDDFDAFLEFGPLTGEGIDITHTDDDSGSSLNARLRVTIPTDGRYGVNARPLGSNITGSYTITVREATISAPRPAAANRDLAGLLADEEFDQWLYSGTAGETLRVSMRSGTFDTVLELGWLRGGELQQLAYNDDESADSTDSLIEFTLPEDGEYIIRARAYHQAASGAYTLRIDTTRR
jgi:hypothetical protein